MIKLIEENRFQELIEKLNTLPHEYAIHGFLLDVLNHKQVEIDGESFDAEKYQEEFIEGFEIYNALAKSNLSKPQLSSYTTILVELAFKMGGFMMLMAKQAMQHGAHLSDLNELYPVKLEVRGELQTFIDKLILKGDEPKAIANLAAAKAKVSNAIGNLLAKYEIGEDMLQFAKSYEGVGEVEMAKRLYVGIMNDFRFNIHKEASSPSLNSKDNRSEKETAVYKAAEAAYQRLSGRVVSNEQVNVTDNDSGILGKITKWFKR